MATSGLLFLLGSMPSVLPFLFFDETRPALALAAVLALGGLFVVGVVKAMVAKVSRIKSGLENMVVVGVGGMFAWFIGEAIGTSLG